MPMCCPCALMMNHRCELIHCVLDSKMLLDSYVVVHLQRVELSAYKEFQCENQGIVAGQQHEALRAWLGTCRCATVCTKPGRSLRIASLAYIAVAGLP